MVELGIYWEAERPKKYLFIFLFLSFVFIQLEVFGINSDSLSATNPDNTITLDTASLSTSSTSPIDKEERKEVSRHILLSGFYDNSIYPSNNLYENWDTTAIFPVADLAPFERDSVKLILQDRENFCNYYTPIQGIITSEFGYRYGRPHEGIDIDLVTGDGVKASFDGMVRLAKHNSSYGNMIIIRHYNGLETLYAHLSKILVKPGDIVNAGEIIAFGGNTGRSTGSHLHFELRFKGKPLKPKSLISFNNNCLVSDSILLVKEYDRYRVIPLGIPFHIVKKGDYLYRIARKYGVSIETICKLNGIRRNDILRVGQRLRLQEVNYAQTFKHQ